MIRLTASVSDHGSTFTLARDGVLIFTTGNRIDAAHRMLDIGISNPDYLIDAAEHWGVVEIREETNPDWRGG
jgi:hypothetical protein